jgi:hypothetical protein
VKRAIVALVGGTILLIGVVLLVTPGPAMVVIPVGLGVLAVEFAWARRWLRRLKDAAGKVVGSGSEDREADERGQRRTPSGERSK